MVFKKSESTALEPYSPTAASFHSRRGGKWWEGGFSTANNWIFRLWKARLDEGHHRRLYGMMVSHSCVAPWIWISFQRHWKLIVTCRVLVNVSKPQLLHLQNGDNNAYLTALPGGLKIINHKYFSTEASIIVISIVAYHHSHCYFCDRSFYSFSEVQAWSSGQSVHGVLWQCRFRWMVGLCLPRTQDQSEIVQKSRSFLCYFPKPG